MREIKFRGKRIDNGEWIHGYLVRFSEESASIVQQYGTVDISIYDVIPETVGQFIGIYDDHDNELYEGSIVKMFTTEWIIAEVKIEFGIPILCSDDFSDSYDHISEYLQYDGSYGWIDCEVIGSIHEDIV